MRPTRGKRSREPVFLRLRADGTFEPASRVYAEIIAARKYAPGDVIRADLTKPRNPRHHRLVMRILHTVLESQEGLLTVEQLLTVIKIRLGRAVPFIDAGSGRTYWVPESIAFDAMEQGAFEEFWRDLCRLIARDYLPGMSPEQVADIAERLEG